MFHKNQGLRLQRGKEHTHLKWICTYHDEKLSKTNVTWFANFLVNYELKKWVMVDFGLFWVNLNKLRIQKRISSKLCYTEQSNL